MSDKPDAELAIKVLEMAYQQRGCPSGVLFHSDQGSQYGSRAFRQRLWRYRMTQSMSRRGNCWERQCADGAVVQKPEVRVATGNGIHEPTGGETGYQLLPDGLLQLAASTSPQ
jgi:hypothetical protein